MTRLEDPIEGKVLDPLAECIAEIGRRYGSGFHEGVLQQLPRHADGRLPSHQVQPALELAGIHFDAAVSPRLPRSDEAYPALAHADAQTSGEGFILLLDRQGDDLLVWDPVAGREAWLPKADVGARYAGRYYTVWGDPDRMRSQEAPWHAKGRSHWFWSEVRRERRSFWPVILASFVINMLAIALPLFTMNVYDRVIPNQATETLWILGIGVVLAFALEFALRRARTSVIDQIARRMDLRLSQKIFGRLLATPMQEKQGHTGSLAARVSEYATVRDFFASTTVVLIVDVLFLFVFVGAIAIIGGWLAMIPLTIIACMLVAGIVLQRKVTDAARDAQADQGLQQTLLVESLAGMETLKSMTGEGGMLGRWHRLAEIGSRSQQRLRDVNSLAVGLAQSFQQISTVSLIIGGYYLFASGQITMGAIIAIVMLAARSLAPAGQIAFLLTRARQAGETLASIERLDEASDERRKGGSVARSALSQVPIELQSVRFAYPGSERAALGDVTLTIRPGERVAVIGRVASGKSTLGRVLCGLYEPSDGAMLVGGLDARQFRPQQLRSAFRYVGQDAALFTGSVKENLVLGNEGVRDERLIGAMQATGADEFLTRDAGGFDRAVGEGGRSLSGGQRAFLALTRALVEPAELLFLDEPTGAMDGQTEKLFTERLGQTLSATQTLVIATHRPALFSVCDRLIVLDRGRVVADGPINEITARASHLAQGASA